MTETLNSRKEQAAEDLVTTARELVKLGGPDVSGVRWYEEMESYSRAWVVALDAGWTEDEMGDLVDAVADTI